MNPREFWGVEFGSPPTLKSTTVQVGKARFDVPILFGGFSDASQAAAIIGAYHKCQTRPVKFLEVITDER